MRARIKFAKYDTMRFIGHLDVMRYFQRMIRRSSLPVKYSEGYHPHQLLSFAQPLGLGITSDGEYVDTEFETELDTEFIKDELNKAATRGYSIIEVTRLHDRENNRKLVTSMSLINRSVYLLILKDKESMDYAKVKVGLDKSFPEFLNRESIKIIKKTKKSEKEIDLKGYIYEFHDYSEGIPKLLYSLPEANIVVNRENASMNSAHAPEFDNGIRYIVSLSAGSEMNIPPERFLTNALNHYNESADEGNTLIYEDFRIHRMELMGGELNESEPLSCLTQ
ncbi:MAG: TIGR03936 family radical SAM-associated protein [Lachnospiraceae bacterium]|nr:TIGR03936 family radical SAM-associated protein [Lachnospiraceae bacterium]